RATTGRSVWRLTIWFNWGLAESMHEECLKSIRYSTLAALTQLNPQFMSNNGHLKFVCLALPKFSRFY
ncbi:MAG: hypothetical protein RBR35_05155, partial [Salinivirgaceae bacterium]|nr:hypothetical protein [Salinivirgaceae bacterium]